MTDINISTRPEVKSLLFARMSADVFNLSVCLTFLTCLSVYLTILFVFPICFSIRLSAGLSVCLSYLSVCAPDISACLTFLVVDMTCLSVCLPICLCCWPLSLSLGAIGVHCSWGNEHGRFVSSPWKPPRHTANRQKNVGGKTCHFPELQLVHLNDGCQGKQADFVNYIRHQTKIFFFSWSRFLPEE